MAGSETYLDLQGPQSLAWLHNPPADTKVHSTLKRPERPRAQNSGRRQPRPPELQASKSRNNAHSAKFATNSQPADREGVFGADRFAAAPP